MVFCLQGQMHRGIVPVESNYSNAKMKNKLMKWQIGYFCKFPSCPSPFHVLVCNSHISAYLKHFFLFFYFSTRNGQIIDCHGNPSNMMGLRCCVSPRGRFGCLTLSSSISKHERCTHLTWINQKQRVKRKNHLATFDQIWVFSFCLWWFLLRPWGQFVFTLQYILMCLFQVWKMCWIRNGNNRANFLWGQANNLFFFSFHWHWVEDMFVCLLSQSI